MSKNARCWRCGKPFNGPFGSAILAVRYADESYSGSFEMPLCDSCLQNPHALDLKRVSAKRAREFIPQE